MSDAPEAPAWVWHGFFGPMAAAVAGKAITDALPGDVAGVKVPLPGEPPIAVDLGAPPACSPSRPGPDALVATPSGLAAANPAMVGRLVGA